ncbi:MAG: DNA-3-methyladenine glycosylase [Chlamydiae bacterium]|nr:DNA-3-methyladenine glycosylase [Chlamydiota bacterium]
MILPLEFYKRDDVCTIAKELLGKYLFSCIDGHITGGMIVETEAYAGATDKACHAYNNRRTKRTETMFQEGGISYVYLCYGMHCLLNVVTNKKDTPHAALIRSVQTEVGTDLIQERRKNSSLLLNGPGKVCSGLGITREHNGLSFQSKTVWIEDRGIHFQENQIISTPRIGVDYAGEDALLPWRYYVST